MGLLGNPSSGDLANILVSVGLAQNFGALRALVTEGVQRGHMSLHARNIAIAAGAPTYAVDECVTFMIRSGRIHQDGAKGYLAAHDLQRQLSTLTFQPVDVVKSPSLFHFQSKRHNIAMNVAFKTVHTPVTIVLASNCVDNLTNALFGSKAYDWVENVLNFLDKVELTTTKLTRDNIAHSKQLKCISMFMNIVTRRLLQPDETVAETIEFIKAFASGHNADPPSSSNHNVTVGRAFLSGLWQIFEFRVAKWISLPLLANEIVSQQRSIMLALVSKVDITGDSQVDFQNLFTLHSSRFQVVLFLLCDAIAFDSNMISDESLGFMRQLGEHFEREQTACHDINRFSRDIEQISKQGLSSDGSLQSGIVNGFLYWFLLVKGWDLSKIVDLCIKHAHDTEGFRSLRFEMKEFIAAVSSEPPTALGGFDAKLCCKATELYRKYYNVDWIYSL